ncbi:hypothetical protein I5907_12115 [Panacibacter sp. DH6]|uniref:Beta-lactamase-inhibitor-like PepSY-like domain-containing protein n=1 Tax=Panacibacter microcysteis TaxID=2793269 RepID=A0A931EAU4_9BACT|nr:hypothetical protein [Panacibacter microcysteis]MBG9376981.1 hypothetical protein [Panacibacter microcysteis]
MKRIMLSAAAIMIISASFANTVKRSADNTKANNDYQALSKKFPGITATVPSTITLNNKLEIKNETDDNIEPTDYMVMMSGKHFGETAFYTKDGRLLGYREMVKDAGIPDAVKEAIVSKHVNAAITSDKEFLQDKHNVITKTYAVKFTDGKKHYKALVKEDGTVKRMQRHLI